MKEEAVKEVRLRKQKWKEDMLVYKVVKVSVLYEVVSTFHVNARL